MRGNTCLPPCSRLPDRIAVPAGREVIQAPRMPRKRKLPDKQKEGKKRMRQFGKVDIPQAAFIEALKMGDNYRHFPLPVDAQSMAVRRRARAAPCPRLSHVMAISAPRRAGGSRASLTTCRTRAASGHPVGRPQARK